MSDEIKTLEDWQTLLDQPKERGQYVFKTGLLSDCSLTVIGETEKRVFKGHRLILAMASPVFEKMFYSASEGELNETTEVEIRDVQPQVFNEMLKYVYQGDLALKFDLAWDVLDQAKRYKLPKLAQKCMKFIDQELLHKNVCKAYELAKILNHEELAKQLMDDICKNAEVIMSRKSFNFGDFSHETLIEILSQPKINATESQLFEGIQRWASSECQRQGLDAFDANNQRKCLGKALFLIRYCSMKKSEFLNGPCKSGLLNTEEQKVILWHWLPPPRSLRPTAKHSMELSPHSRKDGLPTLNWRRIGHTWENAIPPCVMDRTRRDQIAVIEERLAKAQLSSSSATLPRK